MNIVWYRNVPPNELDAVLTDRDGKRRPVSLPPGQVQDELVAEMREFAAAHLAPPIAEVVTGIEEPFIQAVHDIEVPRMAFGRICILGDAAFEDGWVLAAELQEAAGDVRRALAVWEEKQLALGESLLQRTRMIGNGSQFEGTFGSEDPNLIFGLYGPGD
jgi:2,6-dihydroxypyridine 3-monooxygenase